MLAVAFAPDGRAVVTGSWDHTARLWELPVPIAGTVERTALWTQVVTGMEMDEHGVIRILDAATWHQKQQQLRELGGPPVEDR